MLASWNGITFGPQIVHADRETFTLTRPNNIYSSKGSVANESYFLFIPGMHPTGNLRCQANTPKS
jgi:hypothetical protein